ncbi:MAG: response regulator transcription factor [Terracidiphilus sp.]|jgi:DNA-binding NarL/FixJ family response regulator
MTPKQSDISVLIATRNLMAQELLMQALNRQAHLHVVASATGAQEALEAAQSAHVDVALITATLADGPLSGFGLLREIRECAPQVKSVILFESPERNQVVDAFRTGAKGVFCLSKSSFKLLCRCVEQVHAGQIWGNCAELSEVIEAFSQLAPIRVVNAGGMRLLTKREEEVVRLVAEGMQNREIAKELNLSEHTIKNYLFHIFDKLGVSSRVELVLCAVSNATGVQSSADQSDRQVKKPVGRVKIPGQVSAIMDQVSEA